MKMEQGTGKGQDIFDQKLLSHYSDETIKIKADLLYSLKLLWKDKNFKEIIKMCELRLSDLPSEASGKGDQELSAIYLIFATSIWEKTKNADTVIPYVKKCLEFDRKNQPGMWLLREIRNDSSADAKLFRIDVNGEYIAVFRDGATSEVPFSTLYKVIADSPDEAFAYIKDYERNEIIEKLVLNNSKELEAKPNDKKGVVSTLDLIALAPNDVD